MELIERLPATDYAERWLVRDGDALRVACFVHEAESYYGERLQRVSDRWIGVSHPRMATLHARTEIAGRLAYIVDDDRGPALADAAAHLADSPIDRERWTIAQFITLADTLTALGNHAGGNFVYGDLGSHRLFVDPTGHARLRAPINLFSAEPPRPRNMVGAGVIMGSPHFMAPEQALGNPLTPAADVFGLASNLAYALTGALPFEDESFMAVLVKILQQPAPAIATQAPGLDGVIARAFEKDPKRRYATPGEFGAALYECVPDAGDYDAVISDRIAAWWPTAPQADGESPRLEGMTCHKQWDQLLPTREADVRSCTDCNQQVVRIRSIAEAVPLIGSCMAYRR